MTPGPQPPQPRPQGVELLPPAGASALLTLAVVAAVIAALYFGREIFVPLALSVLLSFALAPPVRWLRRLYVPRIPAVLAVVTVAFLVILAFFSVVAWQVADLADRLPAYQHNIEAKIESFRKEPPGGRLFSRAAEMLRDIGRKIEEEETEADGAPDVPGTPDTQPDEERGPIPVEIHSPEPGTIELFRNVLGPLLGPLATAGIVIVLVIFMLLKREDLRDRLIRLAGSRDLPRTTEAMNDAAQRVGHYLLMQLVVNTTYGIPIGVGLWLIGVPNPILWGMLAIVLRFVPYIGPIIAAFFPLALAVAVDPGWSTLLLAGALFVIVELVSNNAVEPWLYGSSTGLSPLAVIAAAIFWTWLWGPIGLLLSTPLTVCLIVLGQHIPRLAFLDVLLGSEPVMSPVESLYQRLLMGDPDEATERAEDCLREQTLQDYYDEVTIPALALAERDRARGALDEDRRDRVAEGTMLLIDNLAEWEDIAPELEDIDAAEHGEGPVPVPQAITLPEDAVVVAGARGNLDDAAAAMLAQLLERQGVPVRLLTFQSLQSARLREIELGDVAMVVLSYMNADSLAHARFLVRRLRRRLPRAHFMLGMWAFPPEERERRDPVEATRADSVVTSLPEAVDQVIAALAPDAADREARAAE